MQEVSPVRGGGGSSTGLGAYLDLHPPRIDAHDVLHASAAVGDDVPIYEGAGHLGGVLAG